MSAESFYDRLPVLDDFSEVTKPQNYASVPEDWYVAVASVQDSTDALESGLYTAVNVVSVAVIATVLNALGKRSIPYAFAGDGALLCVPERHTAKAARALAGARRMARERFGLHLCVGLVPVEALLERQRTVKVACYRLSEAVEQTVFVGRGLQFAEAQVEKHPDGAYAIPPSEDGHADFSGLRCQWAHVPSRKDEIVVLLVEPTAPALSERAQVYEEVLRALKELYGDRTERRPVQHEQLSHTRSPFQISVEHRLQAWSRGPLRRVLYWGRLGAGRLRRLLPTAWRGIIDDGEPTLPQTPVAARPEVETMEGMLREVIAGTPRQRTKIETYLRDQYEQGRLIYGHSCSESALLTCLRFQDEQHIHFVDGGQGGYARAARALRARETAVRRRQSREE